MDKMLRVHSKKSNKQPQNSKKKEVKVVYIANPMKVKTSAEEFRALVQQLTGQDANYPAVAQAVGEKNDQQIAEKDNTTHQEVHNNYVNSTNEATTTDNDNSDLSFKDYVPELLENLPINLWYD